MILEFLVGWSLLAAGGPAAGARGGMPALSSPAQQPGSQAKASTGAEDPYYYFVLGRHLESEGDVDGAIKAFRQAATLDPKSAEIRAELGALYARQNRGREAIEWAEAALALNAGNVEANRVLGIIYAGLARLDDETANNDADALGYAKKALGCLEIVRRGSVALEPGIEMMLGRLYLRTGDTEQAIVTLRRLAEQEPDRGEPTAALAEAYQRAGQLDEAARLLEGAVARHPEFYASLAEMYENQQRWKDASDAYQQALARNPRSLELKTRFAVALLSEGGAAQAGRAATVLQDARVQSPTDAQILYLLAQAQRVAGRLDDAETTARQLTALAPSSFTGSYALAQVYDQKQQYRRVVETLEPVMARPRTAGKSGQELVPLALSLASAYQELGDFDNALSTFERARAMAPGDANIDLYELSTLVAAKRFPDALQRSTSLMASRPDDEHVVRLRAEALRGVGRKQDAVKLLADAVRQHDDDVSAYLALSEMHASITQYDEAVRVLETALAKFPSDVTLRFQLGSVFERARRFDAAERAFQEVLAKDPLYAPALNYLGYMLAERGERLDESINLIRRALQVEPYNGAYLDSLGWAYFKANRLDLAEENLRKAADQRVRDSAVQDHFGDLLYRLGRYRQAVEAWRRALDGDGDQIDRADIDRKIRSASEKVPKQ